MMPKTKQAERATRKSASSSARPMSMLVYFRSSIAMISVPPVEAPMLKSRAEPRAGIPTAKISSRIGSSVRGVSTGQIHSIAQITTERRTLE